MSEETLDRTKEARAVVKYLRISPRKVRLVINAIRKKPVPLAFSALMALNKKAARIVERGLKSAVANAKGKGFEESRLWVSEIKADGGPVLKRFMSRSMGRADKMLRRTTHLTIALREGQKSFGPLSPPSEGKGKEKKVKLKKEKKAEAASAS